MFSFFPRVQWPKPFPEFGNVSMCFHKGFYIGLHLHQICRSFHEASNTTRVWDYPYMRSCYFWACWHPHTPVISCHASFVMRGYGNCFCHVTSFMERPLSDSMFKGTFKHQNVIIIIRQTSDGGGQHGGPSPSWNPSQSLHILWQLCR